MRRWRGTREAFAREVPSGAENLRVMLGQRRIEFFVTRGAPTDRVLQPLNEGLEMVPITHPNDLVAGEPARDLTDAIQLVWLTEVALMHESNASSLSLGRADQYLWPLVRRVSHCQVGQRIQHV